MRQFLSKFAVIVSTLIGALHLWLSWIAVYSADGIEKNYASLTFFMLGLPLLVVQLFLVIVIAIANKGKGIEFSWLRRTIAYLGAIASIVALIIYFK